MADALWNGIESSTVKNVAAGLIAAFPGNFAGIAGAMYAAGIHNFADLGNALKSIGAGITAMADALWNGIQSSTVNNVATGLIAAFPGNFAGIAGAMYAAGIHNFADLGNALKSIGAGITAMADALWNSIQSSTPNDVAYGLAAAFPGAYFDIASAMYHAGIQSYDSLYNALVSIGDSIADIVSVLYRLFH
jgi:hypothetical protein